jgi:hypothetical protein
LPRNALGLAPVVGEDADVRAAEELRDVRRPAVVGDGHAARQDRLSDRSERRRVEHRAHRRQRRRLDRVDQRPLVRPEDEDEAGVRAIGADARRQREKVVDAPQLERRRAARHQADVHVARVDRLRHAIGERHEGLRQQRLDAERFDQAQVVERPIDGQVAPSHARQQGAAHRRVEADPDARAAQADEDRDERRRRPQRDQQIGGERAHQADLRPDAVGQRRSSSANWSPTSIDASANGRDDDQVRAWVVPAQRRDERYVAHQRAEAGPVLDEDGDASDRCCRCSRWPRAHCSSAAHGPLQR